MTNTVSAAFFASMFFALFACATTGQNVSVTTEAAKGEIVLSEAVSDTNATGGNAAVAIGSAIVGALIPGPWGSVASVASGQAGSVAVSSAASRSMRYHVRLPDGSIAAYDQVQAPSLPAGTQVDIITMSDGSKRVVPANPT